MGRRVFRNYSKGHMDKTKGEGGASEGGGFGWRLGGSGGGKCRLVQPLWKTVKTFLRKLKLELPFDPAIPPLGLYPKSPETPVLKNLCTPIFIAALFTIPKC